MINKCANPMCSKPLHYLREGRVFVFDAESGSNKPIHRMEHFWLCGACCQTLSLEKTGQGVRTVKKVTLHVTMQDISQPLAS
jgi:hypothetical protein